MNTQLISRAVRGASVGLVAGGLLLGAADLLFGWMIEQLFFN